MSKLYQFKRWLTLSEAAEHLSGVLSERVEVQDILRLALDRHLVLSVNIVNGITVRLGNRIRREEAPIRVMPSIRKRPEGYVPALKDYPGDDDPRAQLEWCLANKDRFESGDLVMFPAGTTFDSSYTYLFQQKVTTIRGVWDLPMLGAERLDVLHALQQLIDGPEVTDVSFEGTFLEDPETGAYAQVLTHYSENEYVKDGDNREKYPYGAYASYFPAGTLPDDFRLVVRTGALSAFLDSLLDQGTGANKPLGARERNNLLRIIVALASHADIDISERSDGAAKIEALLVGAGFDSPKVKTIREVLAAARNLD